MMRLERLGLSVPVLALLVAACGSDAPRGITKVEPDRGSARGGEVVTIEGHGFGSSPEVRFGGEVAAIKDASDTHIEVIAPRGIAGTVDVEVTSAGDAQKRAEAFTYVALPFTFIDASLTRLSPLAMDGGSAAIADGDIYQAARAEGVWIHVHGGKGSFTETRQLGLTGDPLDVAFVAAHDFDGDGKVDLFLGTTGQTESRLLLGKGKLAFASSDKALPPLFGTAMTAVAVDLDADGDLDLVLTGAATAADGPPGVVVLASDGHGRFTDVTEKRLPSGSFEASGAAAGDVDGDGDPDLFFGGADAPCRLYLNDGRGVLTLASPDAIPYDPMPGAGAPALGDLDGDGSLDVYLPTSGQDRILVNDGSGRFTDLTDLTLGPESSAGKSAAILDLDLDGHADVAVVERPGRLRLYRNDGSGRLFDYSGEVAGNASGLSNAGLAVGDVDGDGDADLFVSRAGLARPSLFLSYAPLPIGDEDGDGFPDAVDNCPSVANPDQENLDSLPLQCASAAICEADTGCVLHASGDSTYLVCGGTTVSWGEALASCEARGGSLVTVETADENAYLTSIGAADAWIGYTDAETEGAYGWARGSGTYTHWGMDQPDDAGGNEDCAAIGADGLWNDLPCDAKRGFVCEDRRVKEPDPGDACDPCPTLYDPSDEPLADGPGTCGAGGGGAGGSGAGGGSAGGGTP